MSTELTTSKPSAMRMMAERCFVDPEKLHQTLKNTVFKGATDDEMLALVVTANVYELNPLLKELYAFPKKGGGITPMVGVDGWLKIANRQPNYDGMTVEVYGDEKNPTHAVCEIFLKDRSHPIKITEYFEECRRNTDPWNQMPRRMLRNKVMIQTIRVAFGIGGIHDEDEASDISDNGSLRETTGRVITDTPTTTKVITGGNTETPAPAKAARGAKAPPAAATQPETAPEPAAPAAVKVPPRPDMVTAIRTAYRAAGLKTLPDAEERARKKGYLGEGIGFSGLKDEEMAVIVANLDTIYVAFPDETPTEGGTIA